MSADSLVFDMSQVSDAPPAVFVRKDWLNILDNQSQNYSGNQCVIDTSQLANSNKYMNYREAYLSIPLLMTLNATTQVTDNLRPATVSCDYALALKGWAGSLIHSLTLDYNGTTIIQQTPLQSIWNVFKLQCSLSWGDIITQGATIGFFPDSALSFSYQQTASLNGIGICNNVNAPTIDAPVVSGALNSYLAANPAIAKRQMLSNYDPAGLTGVAGSQPFSSLFTATACQQAFKSFVLTKIDGVAGASKGVFQQCAMVQVKLKHLHSFFDNAPLLKGVFMRLTMNLNNTSFAFTSAGAGGIITLGTVTSAYSGVNPLMLCSAGAGSGNALTFLGDSYIGSVAVGARALASGVAGATNVAQGTLAQSITLNVPAYTFNPTFESSYLASPVKRIEYTDIYQYQVQNISSGGYVNQLITNGIAGIVSVLIVPFLTPVATATANIGIQVPQIQSPYDTAGCGTTAPLAIFTNFNVVVAGQNMIYNTERYTYEQFINQQYGHLAVNGGLTDGLTSGLIDQLSWETSQCYWYVDCSRMLPVEEQVPKSVNIIGNNLSALALDLIVYVEYKCGLSIDVLSGARVA
jgi:hypothetical protein